MRWPDAQEAVVIELSGSAALSTALGSGSFYHQSAPREPAIPSVSLTWVSENYRDSINDLELQVTIFAHGVQQMIAIERAVRDAIDRYVWSVVGGIYMRCQLIGSVDIPDPEEGVYQRALDFGISLPRERYAQEAAS
jgi:hypothetical protein